MDPRRTVLAGSLVVVYALCYLIIKAALPYAPPLLLGGIRAALGGLAILIVLAATGRRLTPSRGAWRGLLVLAVLGTVVGYAAMFKGASIAGAGIASLLGNTGPLMMILLAGLFLGERIRSMQIQTLLLGLAGVGLIAIPAMRESPTGGAASVLLPVGAALSIAASSVILKRMRAEDDLLQIASLQLLIGAIFLIALSGEVETGSSLQWHPTLVAATLFLGIAGTAFALIAWYWLVQHEELGRLGLLMFAVPVLGLVFGTMVYREPLGFWQVAGAVLILAALARQAYRGGHGTSRSSGRSCSPVPSVAKSAIRGYAGASAPPALRPFRRFSYATRIRKEGS